MNIVPLKNLSDQPSVGEIGHIELERFFAPVDKDKEVPLDTPPSWGRKLYGWMDWSDLLLLPRVVLLAEAGSGKTEEFLATCRALQSEGRAAFFVRVEELADSGLDASLDGDSAARLKTWQQNTETGYFFIDSVDEARLNHKSLETALRHFARELGPGLNRAHILVSCRISDWKGRADYVAVDRLLPMPRTAPPVPQPDADGALLQPIFEKNEKKKEVCEIKNRVLQIVRLVSLSDDNRRALAAATQVQNTDDFINAIARQGLGPLADRPGDLLELAEYWNGHGAFGSLAKMTEYSVSIKLAERDTARADSGVLTTTKARSGAERIAAALTLGHTFTLRAPNQEADPTLAAGALDVKEILPDWSDAERAALLRRGLFAPATYGRVRFHHRGTQEYLAAQWFDRLLNSGGDRPSVMELLFASRYGVDTVVPSLRSEAAWLALKHRDICAVIARREPAIIIANGDPASLPLNVRRDLLLRFAALHQSGDISDDRLDDRALWLFSRGDVADAVLAAWACNTREEFRTYALRIVAEGKLSGCKALWREILARPPGEVKGQDYLRGMALEAARACGDAEALSQSAATLAAHPDNFSEVTAALLAEVLFPQHLTVAQLLTVIDGCRPMPANSVGGFGYALDKLFAACRNNSERIALLGGLADLALTPPFNNSHSDLSLRHHRLSEHLVPLATQTLTQLGNAHLELGLIRALMAIERGDSYHRHDDEATLATSVRIRPLVNRALLWADVDRAATQSPSRPTGLYQVLIHGRPLWAFSMDDLAWLIQDIRSTRALSDRCMALEIAGGILFQAGEWEAKKSQLSDAAKGQAELEQLLEKLSTPPRPSPEMERWAKEDNVHKKKREAEEEEAKQSWRNLRAELQADPARISDPARLSPPEPNGFHDLQNLTRWLCLHAGDQSEEKAVLQWRALEAGFGSAHIADAYREGMLYFWRATSPSWPERREGGVITTYYITEIAHAGICLEAAEDANWAKKLTETEAERASQLACRSGNQRPKWLDDLITEHPAVALPELQRNIIEEWTSKTGNPLTFLYDYAHGKDDMLPAVRHLLTEVVLGEVAGSERTAELGFRILQRARGTIDSARLVRIASARLDKAEKAADAEAVAINIALLTMADGASGVARLERWITSAALDEKKQRATVILARLFGRDSALVPHELNTISIEDLTTLLHLAFTHISPLDDVVHEGVFTPNLRDAAESARGAIVSAIVDRPGPEAYATLIKIGTSGIAGIRTTRFRELAHGKAERDAEIAPWTPKEVFGFETSSMLPVKTANDLYSAALRVLEEIRYSQKHEDVSSRQLLQSAENENQVQSWLAEQLKLRAHNRYHVHREPEVADKKEPDIITSAITIAAEVAIEVKHANKGWSVTDFENALKTQLAEQYLRPANRRHGVLVISLHTPRSWRDPVNNTALSFAQVIERLTTLAETITSNKTGLIAVRVVGIDVT